jgi:hypothetical protein
MTRKLSMPPGHAVTLEAGSHGSGRASHGEGIVVIVNSCDLLVEAIKNLADQRGCQRVHEQMRHVADQDVLQ